MFAAAGREALVCIDGAVTGQNIGSIAACAPDVVVSGSAVFGGKNVQENLQTMLAALRANAHSPGRPSPEPRSKP